MKKPTIKNILLNKIIIQNRRRDKDFLDNKSSNIPSSLNWSLKSVKGTSLREKKRS